MNSAPFLPTALPGTRLPILELSGHALVRADVPLRCKAPSRCWGPVSFGRESQSIETKIAMAMMIATLTMMMARKSLPIGIGHAE